MTTKDYARYAAAGVADYRDRTPGRNEPPGEPLDEQVCAYWDGWQSAVNDGVAKFMREQRQ